jgi:acetyl-CoA decarbonylase/synthase complex subunit delta
MEVYDSIPDDWPEAALEPYKEVLNDPAAWAKKCVQSYGAEMICLQLASTDPNGLNRPSEEAAQTSKKVGEAVDVPVIVWGSGNAGKDRVLRKWKPDGMNRSLVQLSNKTINRWCRSHRIQTHRRGHQPH